MKSYKIYAAQIDALPSSNGRLQKNRRKINVHETGSVMISNTEFQSEQLSTLIIIHLLVSF